MQKLRSIFAVIVLLLGGALAFAGVPHKQMLDARIKTLPQGSSIIFITDAHWNRNAGKSTQQMKYVSEQTGIRTVVFGGDSYDMGDDAVDGLRQLKLYTEDCVAAFGDGFHYVCGNHDANSSAVGKGKCPIETGLIPDSTIFQVTQAHLSAHAVYDEKGIAALSGYDFETEDQRRNAVAWMKLHYYRDLPESSIRLIVLETGNRGFTARTLAGNAEAMFLIQTDFVADALKTMPEGYNAVIVGHQMGLAKGENLKGTDIAGLDQMMQVVSAYGRSASVSIDAKGVSLSKHPMMKTLWRAAGKHQYDFSSVDRPGKVVMLGGHFHYDAFWLAKPSSEGLDVECINPKKYKALKNGDVLCFWVNRDVYKGSPKSKAAAEKLAWGDGPLMEKGQPTEQSFMVLTFTDKNLVLTRFGAGQDYKFKLK